MNTPQPIAFRNMEIQAAAPEQGTVQDREKGFEEILASADINISKHAARRLSRRGIHVSSNQAERLVAAIDTASLKGAKTSLVLMNELALVVRIPERTVVTAMSPSAMRNGLVTQIDSAVVI